MKSPPKTMMAVAFLTLSVLSAQSADIPITSVPFAVTSPGRYVMQTDLTYADTATAITVSTAITGPVVVDLNSHTLTGSGSFSVGVGIGIFAGTSVSNTNLIVVQNGVIRNFGFGVWAEITGAQLLSNIHVKSIDFYPSQNSANDSAGVLFDGVGSSSIEDCTFHPDADTGIEDFLSPGGNRYSNCTFAGISPCLVVGGQNNGIPTVLEHFHVEAPPQ